MHRIGAWVGFAVVHAVLIIENLIAPNGPLGDVQVVYPLWWQQGLTGNGWVGLTSPGVYPFLSLVPIAVAGNGVIAWFALVTALNAVTFGVVARRHLSAAVTWLSFQLLLGPIAIGRIDSVTVALAILVVALADRSPRIAGILLAIATWVKVWPIVIAAAVAHSRQFGRFALWSIGSALTVLLGGVAIGNWSAVSSFISQQGDRGIQVESVIATPWLWDAWNGGASRVNYSTSLLTFEVSGPGTSTVSWLLGITQGLILAALVLFVFVSRSDSRDRVDNSPRVAHALLVLVTFLIVFNKVGSPQFVSWLAVPLVAIALARSPRLTATTLTMIGIVAILTRVLYPYAYFSFLALDTGALVVASIRNLAEVVLLGVALVAFVRDLRLKQNPNQSTDVFGVNEKGVVPKGR